MWRADLLPLDLKDAFDAFEDLRKVERFRPVWAAFNEAAAAKIRLRRVKDSFTHGLPAPRGKAAPPTMRLADVMARSTELHDHKNGNRGCPVCRLHDQVQVGESADAVHAVDCKRCADMGAGLIP